MHHRWHLVNIITSCLRTHYQWQLVKSSFLLANCFKQYPTCVLWRGVESWTLLIWVWEDEGFWGDHVGVLCCCFVCVCVCFVCVFFFEGWGGGRGIMLFYSHGLNVVVVSVFVCSLCTVSWHFAKAFKPKNTYIYPRWKQLAVSPCMVWNQVNTVLLHAIYIPLHQNDSVIICGNVTMFTFCFKSTFSSLKLMSLALLIKTFKPQRRHPPCKCV